FAVSFFKRGGNLNGQLHGALRRHGSAERRALDIFHNEVVGTNIVERADIRMIHRRPVFQTHTFLSLLPRWPLGSLGFTRIVFWVLLGGHTALLSAPSSGQVALKKGILLNGISLKTSQAVNHCITHGTWDHARIRALTPAPLI